MEVLSSAEQTLLRYADNHVLVPRLDVRRTASWLWGSHVPVQGLVLGRRRWRPVARELAWLLVNRQLASTPGVAAQAGQSTQTSPRQRLLC